MKHIEKIGELPTTYDDMMTLLNDAMAHLSLPGLEPLLCVQFTDGFTLFPNPARILIHALMGGCANHPDELEEQSKAISGRHVLITTDYMRYDIQYHSDGQGVVPGCNFGECNLPADYFHDQLRLKLPQQIVEYIFLNKNPYAPK